MGNIIDRYLCLSDDDKKMMEDTALEICNAIRDLSHCALVEQFCENGVDSNISTDTYHNTYDEYEDCDISYVAEAYFEKALEDYILLIWKIHYREIYMENKTCLFSLLENVLDLLSERKYFLQKDEEDIFSRCVGDYFHSFVMRIFEKAEKNQLYINELKSLREEVEGMF